MMKNKKRNFLLIWILALALLLNVLAFVPVVAQGEGRDLLKAEYADEEEFKATLKLFVLKNGEDDYSEIESGQTIEIDKIDEFRYEIEFDIDDGFDFQANDFVSLDLTALNKSLESGSWSVDNYGVIKFGDIVAGTHTFHDGIVKITFKENIEGINDLTKRSGYAYGNFSIEDTGDDLFEEITIPFKLDASITFYIRRTNNATSDIAKLGEYDENDDVIVWTIDVNTKLDDLTNVVLTDVIPEGLIVDKVEIVDLKVKTSVSGITEDGEYKNYPYELSETNEQAIDIDLGNLEHKAKRVKITTSFESGYDGERSFTNKASWTADGNKKSQEVSDTVKTDRLETIGKSVEAVRGTHKIKWTINYVGDGETSLITDVLTIPDGLMVRLVEDSVKLGDVKLSKKGASNSNGSTYSVTLDEDNRTITLSFENLPNEEGETYTITYETETFYNGIVAGQDGKISFDLSNEATYDGSSSTATIEVEKKSVLTKEMAGIQAYGGNTFVYWTIEINENSECWNDVVLTEIIPAGFGFVEAKIWENDDYTDLEEYTDDGANITFNLGDISTKTTIAITTKLTNSNDFIVGDDIKNKAKVEWYLCGSGTGIGIGTGNGTSDKLSQEFEASFDKEDLDHEMWKSGTGITLNGDKTTGIASWEIKYTTYINTLNIEDRVKSRMLV